MVKPEPITLEEIERDGPAGADSGSVEFRLDVTLPTHTEEPPKDPQE